MSTPSMPLSSAVAWTNVTTFRCCCDGGAKANAAEGISRASKAVFIMVDVVDAGCCVLLDRTCTAEWEKRSRAGLASIIQSCRGGVRRRAITLQPDLRDLFGRRRPSIAFSWCSPRRRCSYEDHWSIGLPVSIIIMNSQFTDLLINAQKGGTCIKIDPN
jgi:hypothetical protein